MTAGSTAALAEQVLSALDLTRGGPLVDLPEAERARAAAALFASARRHLNALDLGDEERRAAARNPVLLAETVLDETAPREAAALYALEHDEELSPRRRAVRFHPARLAVARFKLAFALGLDEAMTATARRQLLDFELATSRTIEALPEAEMPTEYRQDLLEKLAERIAGHQAALGLLEDALAGYRALAAGAVSPGRKVAHATYASRILERLDDPTGALAELQAVAQLVPEAEDADDRELWEVHHAALRFELGGRDVVPGRRPVSPLVAGLEQVSRWPARDRPPAGEDTARLASWVAEAAAECPPDDPVDVALRAHLLVQQAVLALDRRDEAAALLDRADELAAALDDPVAGTESGLVRARLRARHGGPDGAEEIYRHLWPRVLGLEPAQRAHEAGFRLEALGRAHRPAPTALLLELVELILAGLEDALRRAPGGTAPARLQARSTLQRPLETALLALLDAALLPGAEDGPRRLLFDRAWDVVLAAHDPELALPAFERRSPSPKVAEAEESFHLLLGRCRMSEGRSDDWEPALQELLDVELATAAPPPPPPAERAVAESGARLAVFAVRDLVAPPQWVVLWRRGDRDGCGLVADPETTIADLQRWARSAAAPAGRRRNLAPVDAPEARPLSFDRLPALAEELLPVAARPEETGPARGPWDLVLDGSLSVLPLEALPDSAGDDEPLGNLIAFRHRLRPRLGDPNRRAGLARGWLGVGVAVAGRLTPLPAAEREVEQLAEWLGRQDVPAGILVGGDAVPDRLANELTARRPAVLHLACHGVDDQNHPEACALVLAPPPDQLERALLPFRRVRDLQLGGVDLVVLSACRSAIGRSARGAPLRGLAWAFLSAGAAQVLASREVVSDERAASFMAVFYRHLLEQPAAEALRRTRVECARDSEVDPRELAAWALWA